ncbi:hypothetical protein LCGC14_1880340 [marine sediment metagenome]|uniref:MaoC-like domain-containing protein n=1 Tax=marine sediment metagenome TaxID=412755 RepID=A0A0F9G2I6_9ZZZZ
MIAPEKLLALRIPEVRQSYTIRDTILYALGLGAGLDPKEGATLDYLLEDRVRALPMMACVLGNPGFWARDLETGLDALRLLHGEQRITLHGPLAPAGDVLGRTRVTAVIDKGADRGALVISERELIDLDTDSPIATITQTAFCRGDGGQGGTQVKAPAPHVVPTRAPDHVVDLETTAQTALIYRLSGDLNPIHSDPDVARRAGFAGPILHGLATYGIAGRALIAAVCGGDETRLRALDARFSSPVFPGETLRCEIWRDDAIASFRVHVPARDVIAIDNGRAEIVA